MCWGKQRKGSCFVKDKGSTYMAGLSHEYKASRQAGTGGKLPGRKYMSKRDRSDRLSVDGDDEIG